MTFLDDLGDGFNQLGKGAVNVVNFAGHQIDKITDIPSNVIGLGGKVVDTVGGLGNNLIDKGGDVLGKGLDVLNPMNLALIGGGLIVVYILANKLTQTPAR